MLQSPDPTPHSRSCPLKHSDRPLPLVYVTKAQHKILNSPTASPCNALTGSPGMLPIPINSVEEALAAELVRDKGGRVAHLFGYACTHPLGYSCLSV